MPGKILFFEDEINQYGFEILSALYESDCISKDVYDECMKEGIVGSNDLFNKHLNAAAIDLVGSTFKDAIAKIESIGKGKDYSLIFIDRNLENYGDIKQREPGVGIDGFSKKFFDFFDNFVGDYLYFRLIQNGVPPEKILFLTGNPDEEFKAAPFIKFSKEQIIVKGKRSLESSDSSSLSALIPSDAENGNEEEQETETQLKKVLVDRGQDTVTRNKYNDIFNSKKIEELFEGTDYLYDFLKLLTQMRSGDKIEYTAGNTLRLMIEKIVLGISPADFNDPVRKMIVKKDFIPSIRKILNKSDYNKNLTLPNLDSMLKDDIANYAKYLDQKKHYITQDDKGYEKYEQYSTHLILTYFSIVFSSRYHTNQEIPKYIFSFIDNIYTTTSECSMHGCGDDTRQLSQEGWYALLNGMCQILYWYQTKGKVDSSGNKGDILKYQLSPEPLSHEKGSLSKRRSGTIKRLSNNFGFLSNEMYFNERALIGIHFKDLKIGDTLEYEIGENNCGPCAVNIRRP